METEVKHILGSNGTLIPLVTLVGLEWPVPTLDEFPPYCGAGDGFLNDIVPEKIWGIKVSPACFVHDEMWSAAEPTWADFHYSNDVFWSNINSILRVESHNRFLYYLRLYRAVTYYNAVDSIGSLVFWGMQAMDPPASELS